jgi:hypothetical protein
MYSLYDHVYTALNSLNPDWRKLSPEDRGELAAPILRVLRRRLQRMIGFDLNSILIDRCVAAIEADVTRIETKEYQDWWNHRAGKGGARRVELDLDFHGSSARVAMWG